LPPANSIRSSFRPGLVDEVLAVGDATFQRKCLGLMGDVAGAGRTVVFVSHNIAAIQQLTHTGLWLEHGRVAAHGPTTEVVERYLSSLQEAGRTVYDLTTARRPFRDLSRAVEFTRGELDGLKVPLLPIDRDLTLALTVHCNQGVDRFRFGLTIWRVDGSAVGTVFAQTTHTIQPGESATYRLQFPGLRLAPGMYSCALSLGIGDQLSERREYDYVRDVLHFQVIGNNDMGIAGEWHATWGAVQFDLPTVSRVT